MHKFTFASLLLAFAPSLVLSASPFREGVPPVLSAPAPTQPAAAEPDAMQVFATGYALAKRPRIAIYWNREFGEQLAARYEEYSRDQSSDERLETGSSDTTKVDTGSASLNDKSVTGKSQHEHSSGTRLLTTGAVRAGAAESVTWRLESAFLFPFLNAGTQLIDRNVTMRMLAGDTAQESRPDAQRIEASALAGKADLLMEVLMTPDADSPIGCRFRVTVKDVRSGAIVGLLSTRALPRVDSSSRWTAVPGGFRKVTATRTPALEEFAERLAQETMYHLASRWGVRG